jgi:hypothetical protein
VIPVIKEIFLNAIYFAILLPLVVALARWRRLSAPFSYLAGFVVIAFLLEAIMFYIATFLHTNNLWVVHIYWPIQFLFFSVVYYQVFKSQFYRLLILAMAVVVPVVSVLEAFVIGSLSQFNIYTRTLAGGLLILYALLYFDRVFRELRVKRLERDPIFLVSAGSLLYFSGTILGYVFMNTLVATSMTIALVIFYVRAGLNVIFKVFLALALWYAARQETERQAGAGEEAPSLDSVAASKGSRERQSGQVKRI